MNPRIIESRILDYDQALYPFAEMVRQHLNVPSLENLHQIEEHELFVRETNQSTSFHKHYYTIGDDYYAMYNRFIKNFIAPMFDESIAYQKIPTFRVHLNGNVGVGEFHRDRDYNHQSGELNFLIPMTNAWGTNTIWIESEEGKGDCNPVKIDKGQVFMFDGANLLHGNKVNDTGQTRVSIDFRIVPMSKYKDTGATSVNMGMRFVIGEYFELLEK